MDIVDLKARILDKTLDSGFIILQYSDTNFIANQYLHEIARMRSIDIKSIESFKDVVSDEFCALNEILQVYRVDTLKENADFNSLNNTIVICKSIDKSLIEKTKEFVVKIPALFEWQVEAYIKSICPGIDDEIIKWLYTITKGDVYRLENEARKLGMFSIEEQANMFNCLNADNSFNDLTTETIFNYLTAVMKKDKSTVYKILKDGEAVDLEGTGLVTLLIRQLKNIIKIQFDKDATPESTGLKYNQFKALKYSRNIYTNDQLVDLFGFITSIDYRIKNGDLLMSNRSLVDYITCKFLSI